MIVDLHMHFPIRSSPGAWWGGGRSSYGDAALSLVTGAFARLASDRRPWSGRRVTLPGLRKGEVGVAFSVLYSPYHEFDPWGLVTRGYGCPGTPRATEAIVRQCDMVERAVEAADTGHVVAHDWAELTAAIDAARPVLVHCVEGGFHLGDSPQRVDLAVAALARRGVVYITLAHLFWRSVAACVPIVPFLPEPLYSTLFPMPRQGLSELGRVAVKSMVAHRVLVDITHMNRAAIEETLAILDEADPSRQVPVIASHAMPRFGSLEYGLDDDVVRAIAERDGVIGLPLASRLLSDGRQKSPQTFAETTELLFDHIDRLARTTGSHRHTAIGSDLDGFVKPPPGLEDASRLAMLSRVLEEHYGAEIAQMFCADNALRVLQSVWGGRRECDDHKTGVSGGSGACTKPRRRLV